MLEYTKQFFLIFPKNSHNQCVYMMLMINVSKYEILILYKTQKKKNMITFLIILVTNSEIKMKQLSSRVIPLHPEAK